jgi:hypothetical protein
MVNAIGDVTNHAGDGAAVWAVLITGKKIECHYIAVLFANINKNNILHKNELSASTAILYHQITPELLNPFKKIIWYINLCYPSLPVLKLFQGSTITF